MKMAHFQGDLTNILATTAPKCPRPPKTKTLVTLRWLAVCPCPRRVSWLVLVTLLGHAQVLPILRYLNPEETFFTIMKMANFRVT